MTPRLLTWTCQYCPLRTVVDQIQTPRTSTSVCLFASMALNLRVAKCSADLVLACYRPALEMVLVAAEVVEDVVLVAVLVAVLAAVLVAVLV